jgi:hypothetical protein
VARNTKLFKEVAETNKKTAAKAVADTDVQRLLYDGSSPIITFGKESTQLNVAIRDEIRGILSSVNAGNGKRLSDLDILQSEVKAGSIPFDAKKSDAAYKAGGHRFGTIVGVVPTKETTVWCINGRGKCVKSVFRGPLKGVKCPRVPLPAGTTRADLI